MNIIFICAGNTCRSPMAERIAQKLAGELGLEDFQFSSAGLAAFQGDSAAKSAEEALEEWDIDLSDHSARSLNAYMVDGADLLVPMTKSQEQMLLSSGVSEEKIHCFSEEVSDPFGGDIEIYRACRDKLSQLIRELIDERR